MYTATVSSYIERGIDHFLLKPPTTYGIIVVRPAIEPGELFKDTVLGKERCLVDIRMLFKTGKATVFLAESSIEEQEDRHRDVQDIAKRIGELANKPDLALRLMHENPFAEPAAAKSAPHLEAVPVDESMPDIDVEAIADVEVVLDTDVPASELDRPVLVEEPSPVRKPQLRIPTSINPPTVRINTIPTSDFAMNKSPNLPWPPYPNGEGRQN